MVQGVDRSVKGRASSQEAEKLAKALGSAHTHPAHSVAKAAGKGCGTKKVPRGGGASGQAHRVKRGSAEEGRRIFNDKIIKEGAKTFLC